MTDSDHLALAREYIAKGEDYYRRAADEILAARKANHSLTYREIGERLGRSESWVYRLVQSRTNLADPQDSFTPFGGEEENKARYERQAKTILKDPERLTRAIRELSDDERERVVDTTIHVTAQEATAKAREHQTEPTLADTGPIHDRTEYEIDVPLTTAWRWARVAAQIVEARGVWIGEDRYDEMLQRAQELESAAAQVRAAIQEAVNERSMA